MIERTNDIIVFFREIFNRYLIINTSKTTYDTKVINNSHKSQPNNNQITRVSNALNITLTIGPKIQSIINLLLEISSFFRNNFIISGLIKKHNKIGTNIHRLL